MNGREETTARPVALVTGASRGLGAAIACMLARDGTAVAINYRRDHAAANTTCEQVLAGGGAAETFAADVTRPSDVRGLHEAVTATFGEIDVLVCNATGPQPDISVEDLTWPDVQAQLEFFVRSPLLLSQAVLPSMRHRRTGRIIMIGSEVADLGAPYSSAYAAAKAAQLGLTRSWARELGPDGITVNLVAPGFVPTERHRHLAKQDITAHTDDVPLKRIGRPADIAAAVNFLASPAAGFITGQRICVNGGRTSS